LSLAKLLHALQQNDLYQLQVTLPSSADINARVCLHCFYLLTGQL
jgi:hypothetical protein